MAILQSIRMALRSIKGNKLRSVLTMLGIIIGVSSVIVLVSIAQGSTANVTNQINSLGTNLITINTFGTSLSLTEDKIDQLGSLSGIQAYSPVVSGRITANVGATSEQTSLIGTNAAYETVRNVQVSDGRFLTDIDQEYRSKIAVIGATTAQNLFGSQEPVGQYIQLDGNSFEVVGVLAAEGSSMGQSGDDTVIIPISTAERLIKTTSINQVYLQGKNGQNMNFVMAVVQNAMNNLYPNQTNNYSVTNEQNLMNTMSSVTNTMTMMLGGIASISLLVGGIGIMNIMLVSVSERTKEIGIRKAIGAKRRDILLQFLIESVVLSAMGGIIGILFGLGIGKILGSALSMTVSFSGTIILFSFLFSLVVGIVFGVFPANKASKLNPIQALRYE